VTRTVDADIPTYGSDRLLAGGNMQGFVTQPQGSYDDVIGDTDMAAITTAVIAGGSLLANYLGQRSASKQQAEQFQASNEMARAGLDYNIRRGASNFDRQVPFLRGRAQSYAGVMGDVGIKGLPTFDVGEPGELAFKPPPGSLAELEAGQDGAQQVTPSGYMDNLDEDNNRDRPFYTMGQLNTNRRG